MSELQAILGLDDSYPSFEYVRTKYGVGVGEGTAQAKHGKVILPGERRWASLSLFIAAIPYMIMCSLGFIVLFGDLDAVTKSGVRGLSDTIYRNMFLTMSLKVDLLSSQAIVSAAFLGAYLSTARRMLNALQNYEIRPQLFLQCAVHVGFGVSSAMLSYLVLSNIGIPGLDTKAAGFALFIAIAFFAGYFPDYRLNLLQRAVGVHFSKRDPEIREKVFTLPPELIDGIDFDIKDRLSQNGIFDVQHLATANPLQLAVETPYGLYQIFDWVLQAQLCLAVGSESFVKLNTHGIRTSLDLERAILAKEASNAYIRFVGVLMYNNDLNKGITGNLDGIAETHLTAEQAKVIAQAIQHRVKISLDDIHIHRIRALWEHIYNHVGAKRPWIYARISE